MDQAGGAVDMISSKLPWETMNPILASSLNPILANPINQCHILTNIVLASGSTTFNHGLGKLMQGWIIVDRNSAASIYRSAPLNALNLTLTSSAPVTVNIAVF